MKNYLFILALSILLGVNLSWAQNPKLSQKEIKQGWTLLFDGVSTKGWMNPSGKPVTSGWEINDGCISTTKGVKGGDIITVDEFYDFDLSVDFKIVPGCNSGIKYFYTKYDVGGNHGIEYQIID